MLAVAEELEQGTLDEEVAWRQFELACAELWNLPPPAPKVQGIDELIEKG